jgi:hypothetical protein
VERDPEITAAADHLTGEIMDTGPDDPQLQRGAEGQLTPLGNKATVWVA